MSFKVSPQICIKGMALILGLAPVVASADPAAIKVPMELRAQPEVAAMIKEYEAISGRVPKKGKNYCADKALFGLRTYTIDGQTVVRFYVDGLGVGCLPDRLENNEIWKVEKNGWYEKDFQAWQQFISTLGNSVEAGNCRTVDSCMISSANILRTERDLKTFHYSDCADFPYYLRTYFSFRRNLPFSLASRVLQRKKSPEEQMEDAKVAQRSQELMDKVRMANNGDLAPYIAQLPPPSLPGALGYAEGVVEVPGLTLEEKLELNTLMKKQERLLDPRYSDAGNFVARRFWVTQETKERIPYSRYMSMLRNAVSTATLRIMKRGDEQTMDNRGNVFPEEEPDFYSPALTPQGIVIGTVIYKTDGHTAIVYKVDYNTGAIYYIDAHPDNSISYGTVDETWTRNMVGNPVLGGGFKNFRPIKPAGQGGGGFFGGLGVFSSTRMASDSEMMKGVLSFEQFEKFPNSKALVQYSDRSGFTAQVNYLDFLRLRMSNGRYRIDPISQFMADAKGVCRNMQIRRDSLKEVTDRDFHLQPHPSKLPGNIWGAQGDWEKFSSPGRDVVFKQRVGALIDSLGKYRRLIRERSPLLADQTMTVEILKLQLLAAWQQVSENCDISYPNSQDREIHMNLIEAIRRVPYMDFDPYLCPERRYGAFAPGVPASEMATCVETPDKAEWSRLQQGLRNRTEKNPKEPMGWSMDEMRELNQTQVDPNLVNSLDVAHAIRGL